MTNNCAFGFIRHTFTMTGLTPFPKFDVFGEESSLGVRWDKYVAKLENLFVGPNIDSKKRRKALLLQYAGDEVFEINQTFEDFI